MCLASLVILKSVHPYTSLTRLLKMNFLFFAHCCCRFHVNHVQLNQEKSLVPEIRSASLSVVFRLSLRQSHSRTNSLLFQKVYINICVKFHLCHLFGLLICAWFSLSPQRCGYFVVKTRGGEWEKYPTEKNDRC